MCDEPSFDNKQGEMDMGSTFERHGQTVLQVLITLLLAWFGLQVVEQGKAVVKLEATMNAMSTQLTSMQQQLLAAMSDGYGEAEARHDQSVVHSRIEELVKRVERLEGTK